MRRSALESVLVLATLMLSACQPSPAAQPASTTAPPASTSAVVAGPSVSPASAPSASAAPSPSAVAIASPLPTSGGANGPTAALKTSYSAMIGANLPLWLAAEAGIYQKHGLDAGVDYIASSTGIPALLSGQVQVANVGGTETLGAVVQGADLVIIGTTLPVYPFVMMAPASITSVDQLRGKKVGVSNVGSTSDTATRIILRRNGLDPDKDVTIVPVGSLSNRMAALLGGAIDAGVAQPPEQLGLQDKGFHVIYDLAAQKVPAAGGAVLVQRSWLNTNRDVAQRYIDALVEAAGRARQDRALAISVLQKYLNTDDQRALAATYDFFVGSVIPPYPVVNAAQFGDSIDQLVSDNPGIRDYDLSKLLDNSFVQSAMDRHVGGP